MSEETKRYVEYARQVVAGLCELPDQVAVERTEDERGILLSVKVAKEDMPRVIGKQGATVDIIRKLVKTAGMLEEARVSLKIVEPDGSDRT